MMDHDPFADGREARDASHDQTTNPYDQQDDFDAHCAWNDGWAEADADDGDDGLEAF